MKPTSPITSSTAAFASAFHAAASASILPPKAAIAMPRPVAVR